LELHQKSEIVSKMLLDYLSNIPTLEYQASSLFEQAKQYHWNSIAFTYQKTYEA
jgi:peptidase E